jgi:hypothetical protein
MTWLCHLQLLDIAGLRRRVQALVCQVHFQKRELIEG